jgi:hypothetical protein
MEGNFVQAPDLFVKACYLWICIDKFRINLNCVEQPRHSARRVHASSVVCGIGIGRYPTSSLFYDFAIWKIIAALR